MVAFKCIHHCNAAVVYLQSLSSGGGAVDAKRCRKEILAQPSVTSMRTEELAGNEKQLSALRIKCWVVG